MRGGVTALLVALAGTACNEPTPQGKYRSLTMGTSFSAGSYGCLVSEADQVLCWGAMDAISAMNGTLSRPTLVPGLPPVALVRATQEVTWASSWDAGVYWWGPAPRTFDAGCGPYCPPRRVDGIGSVSALAASFESACGLVGDEVWCWGYDVAASLYRAPRRVFSGARDVTMSYGRVCAVMLDSTVTCWDIGASTPEALVGRDVASYSNGCALTHDARLWCDPSSPVPPPRGVEVLGLREGAFNVGNCVATSDGQVICWDHDDAATGRVIDGVPRPRALSVVPFPRGARRPDDEHACALTTEDEVWCWSVDSVDAGVHRVTGLP